MTSCRKTTWSNHNAIITRQCNDPLKCAVNLNQAHSQSKSQSIALANPVLVETFTQSLLYIDAHLRSPRQRLWARLRVSEWASERDCARLWMSLSEREWFEMSRNESEWVGMSLNESEWVGMSVNESDKREWAAKKEKTTNSRYACRQRATGEHYSSEQTLCQQEQEFDRINSLVASRQLVVSRCVCSISSTTTNNNNNEHTFFTQYFIVPSETKCGDNMAREVASRSIFDVVVVVVVKTCNWIWCLPGNRINCCCFLWQQH